MRGQADTKEEIPEVEITQITQEEAPLKEEEKIGQDVLQHIVTAGQAVMRSYQKRPQSHELTAENTADFAKITECVIAEGGGRISVTAKGDGIPKSDDKYYYLFEMNTYDTGLSEEASYLDRVYKDSEITMSASLNTGRLYKNMRLR